MKSLYFDKYGSSEVLSFREIPRPKLDSGNVLIKVSAAAVNPLDWRLMRADPFLARMSFGLRKPKLTVLGADFSGVVESVAQDVSDFKPGDSVSGIMSPHVVGSFAEYISVPRNALVRKPESLSHQEASTLGVAALTAYEGIHDYFKIANGDRVLINGASGGIGTFAVQMAKALGADVTGVCSVRNRDLVLSLGADDVIDYNATDLLKSEERFDLVFDTIGNYPAKKMKSLLSDNGRLVLASATNSLCFIKGMFLSRNKNEPIDMIVDLNKNQQRLQSIADLAEAGVIKPFIDREYPFNEIAEAIDYVATKRARGKVVVKVDE